MSNFWRAASKSKPYEQEETQDTKAVKSGLKTRVTAYKKRASSIKSEEGSPLDDWKNSTVIEADRILNLIENPELVTDNDIDIETWMRESELDYTTIINNNGGSIEAASKKPIANTEDFFKEQNIKNQKNEAVKYQTEVFEKLDENQKSTVVDNVRLFNNAMEAGIYEDYNSYITEIRNQFQAEDKLLTENPALKSELERIKTLLKRYDASILWGRFKAQNPESADIKSFLKEEIGLTPIIVMNKDAEAEYNRLIKQYKDIIKGVTGFETNWNPLPLDFKKIEDGSGGVVNYMAYATSDTEVVNWTIDQIKDRGKLISYAAGSHISSDIEKSTGLNINEFNKAIDSILAKPENYHSGFISGLENLNETIDYIIEGMDVNIDELQYKKTEFLGPATPKLQSSQPGAARIDYIEGQ